MSRISIESRSAAVLRAAAGPSRWVDIRLELRAEGTEELLLSVGGRWSPEERAWSGDGAKARVLYLHEGQLEAGRWWARWLRGFITGAPDADLARIWTMFLGGGRRGGKSDLALKCLATFCVAFDGALAWAISPTQDETQELRDGLDELLPLSWIRYYEADEVYEFAHGSRLFLRSGFKASSLKRGRVDLVVLNEAHNMSEAAYAMVRPATGDIGGLTILTCNPPDKPLGRWVDEFYLEAKGGKRHARVFEFDATRNPHVVHESLEDLKDDLDPVRYARDVLGEFGLPLGDRVLYTWSSLPTGNVRPTPATGCCAAPFFRRHLGREYAAAVGMDFQISPHLAAVLYLPFVDPSLEDPLSDPLLWVPAGGGIAVEGDENDLVDALEALGLDGKTTAAIVDASGETQDAAHKPGRTSWAMLRARGWTNLLKPDARQERNPLVLERVAISNARVRNAAGKRRLFSDPANVALNKAAANWEIKNNFPARRGHWCHMGDAMTYPLCRLYPRARPKTAYEYKRVEPGRSARRRDLDEL